MTHPAQTPSMIPAEIPDSFFLGLPDPVLPRANPDRPTPTAPMRAMILYDAIIDEMFLDPATNMTAVAKKLGRSPNTVSLIVRSDFFRARWLQRRDKFNEDLSWRLQNKMALVAEKSLDATLDALNTRTNIPLPVLREINESVLDRMGYNPRSGSAPVGPAVQVNVQNNTASSAVANGQASPEGLARAREYLQILERRNADSGARPGNGATSPSRDGDTFGPVVEGEAHRVGT